MHIPKKGLTKSEWLDQMCAAMRRDADRRKAGSSSLPLQEQWADLRRRDDDDRHNWDRAKQRAAGRVENEAFGDMDQQKRDIAKSLGSNECLTCFGLGCVVLHGGNKRRLCACVYRNIFRKCLGTYHDALLTPDAAAKCILERSVVGTFYASYKHVEYATDLQLVAKRSLSERAYVIFKHYLMERHEWSAVAAKVGMDRLNFYHEVYRIQALLGRVYLELEPYPLYPVRKYFAARRVYAGQFGKAFVRKKMWGGDTERL